MMGSGSDGRPVGLPTALCGSYTRSTRFDQGFNPVRTEAPKATPASMPVGMGRSPVSDVAAVHDGVGLAVAWRQPGPRAQLGGPGESVHVTLDARDAAITDV